MSNNVIALHSAALDRASDDDRIWFEQHPSRNYRLREMIPFESNDPLWTPPKGSAWLTVTRQIEPGVRLRTFIHGPRFMLDAPEADDDEKLSELFKWAMPEPGTVKRRL